MELRKFLFSQAVVSAAVLVADVCSFVFYGQALQFTPEQFAEVSAVTALNFVLTVFSATVGTFVLMRTKEQQSVAHAVMHGTRIAMCIGGMLLLAFWLCSPFLARALHFTSLWPFFILGVSAVPGMMVTVLQSLQNAQKEFGKLAIGIVVLGAARIPAAALFFSDGFHSVDTPLSILFAVCTALAALVAMNGHALGVRHFVPQLPTRKEVRALAELLWSFFIVGALLKMDILWAKHALDPETAGVYGMTSLLASVLYYMTMGVSRPAMSYVNFRTLKKVVHWSVVAILVVCAAGVVGYFLIGGRIFARISDHASDIQTLALLLLFLSMTCYSVLSFCVQCLGVLHRSVHVKVMSAVVLADAVLLPVFGVSMTAIALIQALCVSFGALASYAVLLRHSRTRGVA